MIIRIYKDADELTTVTAEWISDLIAQTLKKAERFTIALSGGNTPKQLFTKLGCSPYLHSIDWSKVHFFWGDERFVPFRDERNNANMAFKELLEKVPLQEDNVHIMRTDIPSEESVKEYDRILHNYFDEHSTSFDLVLLGLGEDGHTLSLFPGIDISTEPEQWVTSLYVPEQNMWRITLLPAIVNKAANIAFMVSGSTKSEIVHKVIHTEHPYPAKLIQPATGKLYWLIDEAASTQGVYNP